MKYIHIYISKKLYLKYNLKIHELNYYMKTKYYMAHIIKYIIYTVTSHYVKDP